jgi:hypothetical protein
MNKKVENTPFKLNTNSNSNVNKQILMNKSYIYIQDIHYQYLNEESYENNYDIVVFNKNIIKKKKEKFS